MRCWRRYGGWTPARRSHRPFAPIEERLDDEVTAPGVPSEEKVFGVGVHQDMLWAPYLQQFKGTLLGNPREAWTYSAWIKS